MTSSSHNILLKSTEYSLMSALWKYRGELFSTSNGLTKEEMSHLELRWNILKNATEEFFKQKFDSSNIDKIGNI